jgi:hypothetical protein
MATPAPLRYHGVGYSDTRLDTETRRYVKAPPLGLLRLMPVGSGAKLREVPMTRTELVKLIRDASACLARMDGV